MRVMLFWKNISVSYLPFKRTGKLECKRTGLIKKYAIVRNKYPYAVIVHNTFEHWVFFAVRKYIPAEVKEFVMKQEKPRDCVVYENPDTCKSIPDLWHMQVIIVW